MILVDDLVDYGRGPRGHTVWCHMGTDDHGPDGLRELHAMADRIGLRRSYFQDKPGFPHYDLTPSRRRAAVGYGAAEVSAQEYVRRTKREVPRETSETNGWGWEKLTYRGFEIALEAWGDGNYNAHLYDLQAPGVERGEYDHGMVASYLPRAAAIKDAAIVADSIRSEPRYYQELQDAR